MDAGLLGEAAEILETTTNAATVNAALTQMIRRQQRRDFFDWLESGGLPDLTGPIEHTQEPSPRTPPR